MRSLIFGTIKLMSAFAAIYFILLALLSNVSFGDVGLIYRSNSFMKLKTMNSWLRFQEYSNSDRYDVVVIGSSHAYRGYDPRIFAQAGYRMFNLGSPAQTFINTWPIVRSELTGKNTSLLILDVYMSVFESDGKESAVDLIPNLKSDLVAADVAWRVLDPRVVNLFSMRFMNRHYKPFDSDEVYVNGGYTTRGDSVSGEVKYHITGAFDPDDWQVCHLRSIISYCRSMCIPLAIVTHPMPLSSDTLRHQAMARYLKDLLGEEGPHYFDFALDHSLNDRHHFYDHNHLNQAGVDLFIPRLIDSLEAHGLLRRTDIP